MDLTTILSTSIGVVAFAAAGLTGRDGPGRFGRWQGSAGRIRGFASWDWRGRRVPGQTFPERGRRPTGGASAPRRRHASWASARDLGPLQLPHRHAAPSPASAGRLVLGRMGRKLVAAERAQSVIVFGPTQSYKTSGLAVPAILEWDGPVMAASVKTDLIEHTIGHRRSCGSVTCFDPTGSTGLDAAPWSPLHASRTWPGARRSAANLTEVAKSSVGTMSDGDFWYATAAKMLAPLLFAAAFGRRDMADVVRWVDTQEQDEVLDLLTAAGVDEAVNSARSTFGKEDRQRSSIYTTVETILEPFAEPSAEPFADGGAGVGGPDAAEPAIDPARLVAGSNTLYLCAPAHDQRRLTPLFVSVIRQVLEHVYDQVSRTGHPIDPRLLVVLDEAANIAPLFDLDALASTAAGHGVQLVTVWHDLAQITARYGPRASTVVNNHRAKLFLSGISDPSTLDYASHLIGDEEVVLPATTHGGQSGPSTTRSPSVRRLAPPDELRRISPGEGVLVYGNLPPARLRLRSWFDDRRLAARAATPPEPSPGGVV